MKKVLILIIGFAVLAATTNIYASSNECSYYLDAKIENSTATDLIQFLDDIENDANCEDATLYIMSGGGSITATFGMVAKIANMEKKVNTFCLGSCASAAAILLASGTGERTAYSTAVIMIHQVNFTLPQEAYENVENLFEFYKKLNDQWSELVARYTKLSKEEYTKIISENYEYNMSAAEAQKLGFIDKILPGMI